MFTEVLLLPLNELMTMFVYVSEEQPIFGVALSLAVERSRCHDGVEIPLVVRECIDQIQELGK